MSFVGTHTVSEGTPFSARFWVGGSQAGCGPCACIRRPTDCGTVRYGSNGLRCPGVLPRPCPVRESQGSLRRASAENCRRVGMASRGPVSGRNQQTCQAAGCQGLSLGPCKPVGKGERYSALLRSSRRGGTQGVCYDCRYTFDAMDVARALETPLDGHETRISCFPHVPTCPGEA